MLPLLRAGSDFDYSFLLELDGDAESVTGYTMAACVVDERKRTRLIQDEAATAISGVTGGVRIQFSATNTAQLQPWVLTQGPLGATFQTSVGSAYQREAWLELSVVNGSGKRLPVAHAKIMVELGWTGVL